MLKELSASTNTQSSRNCLVCTILCLPPSAPVERLLSLGGAVLTPKQNRSGFEKMLLMLCNKHFLDDLVIG